MPELPEVETTRLGFADRIAGARVTSVRSGKPLRWPLGIDGAALVGRTVAGVTRRGKYLWLAFAEGDGLLLHLGMSGSLVFGPPRPDAGAHDHFDLVTDRGTLRLTDPRRFGAVVWSPAVDQGLAGRLLASLGLEPFDPAFDGPALHRALQRRSVAVKQALLAGDIVTGAGNIYACEALFDAGIDPRLPADKVSRPRAARLAAAIPAVLDRALNAGGSTLRNYRNADGEAGAFQRIARVYGRAGQPCVRCGTQIRRIVQGGRATFFCPVCQRR